MRSVPWSTVLEPSGAPAGGAASRPARNPPRELAALAALVGAAPVPGRVRGVSASSAEVRPGDLFAALPGTGRHGIDYLPRALAAGAVAVLTDPAGAARVAADVPVLVVDQPRAVLGRLSAEVYGNPSQKLPVLGVTGTSGKTTTTFLLRAGLAAAGIESGLIGTIGVFVGQDSLKLPFTTPEAPQLQALLAVMVERGLGAVSMEVSSHALRQGRVDGTRFAVGAFTNLSQDHLDFHSDMQDYFSAKALLFDGRAAREVVMVDDEWGRRLVTEHTVTVSVGGVPAAWTATDIHTAADGSSTFTVHGDGLSFAAGCCIPGRYNVANTLLACAMLAQLGIDVPAVAGALARTQVPGRMQRVDAGQPFMAVVDYSHKPAGVAGALQALRSLTAGRLIIVLGCGGDRDRAKRPVMGEVAARGADVLVVTDDNPRSEDPAAIRAAMLAGAARVDPAEAAQVIEQGDRRLAIHTAIELAGPGDTVLVAGKGHETGQEVAGTMLSFDDVSVVRAALAARGYLAGPAAAAAPGPDVSSA